MSKLYLGRECPPSTLKPDPQIPAMLDARELVRHAVCLGMTGSGKTGLCVCLLEEVAMSGVPIIAIDPKGDLTNLALSFPELRPKDFEPWIDPAEAARKGVDQQTRAEQVASMWSDGHASWNVDAQRRRAFADCPVTIYTPGSHAGVPVNVLGALAAPSQAVRDDPEGLIELASGAVTSLLGLVGVQSDPFRDPEAIVLTQIVHDSWSEGRDLDMTSLLGLLIDPPFAKVGVFPVDSFFSRKKRTDLAMKLNAVVASPAFAPWSSGVALDLDAMLAPASPAPIHIFYTAHLDESQRQFFASTLLNAAVSWSRRQPGTGDLRALIYFDEVYGYLPPHPKNPPTKRPILTLMKQARAVGVGVMLATQNPVDLDYKALSNAGTWLVGRLQTDQDRERVLDGLAGAGAGFDRGAVDGWLQQLPSRTFVHRSAKSPEPRLLHSRWAISYLRGPLTRRELERLDQDVPELPAPPSAAPAAVAPSPSTAPVDAPSKTSPPPPCPEGFTYRYLAPGVARSPRMRDLIGRHLLPRTEGPTRWAPAIWARLHLRFDEGQSFVVERTEQRLYFPLERHGEGVEPDLDQDDFLDHTPEGSFDDLPEHVDETRELNRLKKAAIDQVYRSETTTMFRHKGLRLVSRVGEDGDAFRDRVQDALQDRVDDKIRAIKGTFDGRADKLQARLTKKQNDRDRANTQVRSRQTQEVVNVGEALFGMFFGGRKRSLSGAVSKRRQTLTAQQRVARLDDELAALHLRVIDLQQDLVQRISDIQREEFDKMDVIEEREVRLEKNDIDLRDFQIVWIPLDG